MAYPKTIYFPDSDNRAIVNVMPGGRFSAIDSDQPQDGEVLIWGLGNTELEAIADLAQQIREAE
jgi:hypothetical protein